MFPPTVNQPVPFPVAPVTPVAYLPPVKDNILLSIQDTFNQLKDLNDNTSRQIQRNQESLELQRNHIKTERKIFMHLLNRIKFPDFSKVEEGLSIWRADLDELHGEVEKLQAAEKERRESIDALKIRMSASLNRRDINQKSDSANLGEKNASEESVSILDRDDIEVKKSPQQAREILEERASILGRDDTKVKKISQQTREILEKMDNDEIESKEWMREAFDSLEEARIRGRKKVEEEIEKCRQRYIPHIPRKQNRGDQLKIKSLEEDAAESPEPRGNSTRGNSKGPLSQHKFVQSSSTPVSNNQGILKRVVAGTAYAIFITMKDCQESAANFWLQKNVRFKIGCTIVIIGIFYLVVSNKKALN
jgi:hypothetical protein